MNISPAAVGDHKIEEIPSHVALVAVLKLQIVGVCTADASCLGLQHGLAEFDGLLMSPFVSGTYFLSCGEIIVEGKNIDPVACDLVVS